MHENESLLDTRLQQIVEPKNVENVSHYRDVKKKSNRTREQSWEKCLIVTPLCNFQEDSIRCKSNGSLQFENQH